MLGKTTLKETRSRGHLDTARTLEKRGQMCIEEVPRKCPRRLQIISLTLL